MWCKTKTSCLKTFIILCAGLVGFCTVMPLSVYAASGGSLQKTPTRNTADIVFQSMCSGGGTKGILDVDFPVQISWRCSKCGRKTEITVPLVKNDNTDSVAKKMAQAINTAVAGSDNVSVQYFQSSATKKQDQNWYRIRFTGVDQVDVGAWHSKLKLYVLTWPGVRYVRPGPLPENITPGKPGRTLKPGKELKGNKKKRKYAGPGFFGWKEVYFNIGLHPWRFPIPTDGSFIPSHSYRYRYAESDPDPYVFNLLEADLLADGFQIERLDHQHLAILGGPGGTIVATMLMGTYLNDANEANIDQEEHWTLGDIVSSSDEDPVPLSEDDELWFQNSIQTSIQSDLSEIATGVALIEGLIPWAVYPELLAQEPYDPNEDSPSPSTLQFCIGEDCYPLVLDPNATGPGYSFMGTHPLFLQLNFQAKLSVTVSPTSPAGGVWTAEVFPNIIGPGLAATTLWIYGEDLNLAALPGDSEAIQVAEVKLWVVPASP
ncbi:hypothetical protein ACFL6U_03060 [Planctomycetota bacterium]